MGNRFQNCKMPAARLAPLLLLLLMSLPVSTAFSTRGDRLLSRQRMNSMISAQKNDVEEKMSLSYDDTDASSKGLVSSLTNLVNFFSFDKNKEKPTDSTLDIALDPPPKTPAELLERIRADYVERNYLWTGKIDLAAFDPKCRFTDPTLSFEGTDQFVKNLNNLVPIVDALIEPGGCKSDLLQIVLYEDKGYVQTRWNMVGSLTGLPWSPMIDVIGRTKFWYRPTQDGNGFKVYFYDEEWEIPAGKALLQLITPAGTIKNQ